MQGVSPDFAAAAIAAGIASRTDCAFCSASDWAHDLDPAMHLLQERCSFGAKLWAYVQIVPYKPVLPAVVISA